MCGRYTQTATLKELHERFKLVSGPPELPPRYNLAPSQPAPVILPGRALELYRWGLVPSWAKDPAIGHRMINARAETLMEKPSFRKPLERSRCLVPSDGFYEWKKLPDGRTKVPMRITRRDRGLFAMAGLWDEWKGPEGPVRSFTIITTGANAALSPIHDRMPVILDLEGEDRWLDPGASPTEMVGLLKPCPDDCLSAYEVSTRVNSPADDSPACIDEAPRRSSS